MKRWEAHVIALMVVDSLIETVLGSDADYLYSMLREQADDGEPVYPEFAGLVTTDDEFRKVSTEMMVVRHRFRLAKESVMRQGKATSQAVDTTPPRDGAPAPAPASANQ